MTGRSRESGCSTSAAARAGSCAQFLPEAASGEFWGCDLHRPTIAWLEENLSPPLRFYVNDRIPTPHPDSHFDLVYAISVFTHITHEWSAWLLELHRVLKPDGLLLATFWGPGFGSSRSAGRRTRTRSGCVCKASGEGLVTRAAAPASCTPPGGFAPTGEGHSRSSRCEGDGFVSPGKGHGVVVGRKKDVTLTRDDLERPDTGGSTRARGTASAARGSRAGSRGSATRVRGVQELASHASASGRRADGPLVSLALGRSVVRVATAILI